MLDQLEQMTVAKNAVPVTWTNDHGAEVTLKSKHRNAYYTVYVAGIDTPLLFSKENHGAALDYANNALPPSRRDEIEAALQEALRTQMEKSTLDLADAPVDPATIRDTPILSYFAPAKDIVEHFSSNLWSVFSLLNLTDGFMLEEWPMLCVDKHARADRVNVMLLFRITE